MTTNNKSDTKISSVQVLFTAISTTLHPTDPVNTPYQQKQYTLLTEQFYVSIPKHAKNHQDIFRFHVPSNIVPTFTNKLGKYIDISYEVIIQIDGTSTTTVSHSNGNGSSGGGSWFGNHNTHISNTISLPIIIATVPPYYPIGITVHDNVESELPAFIPNVESPLPSPVVYPADRAYSVSPACSFQMSSGDDLEDDGFSLNNNTTTNLQDATGHLMVPDAASRRKSSASSSSDMSLDAVPLTTTTVSHS